MRIQAKCPACQDEKSLSVGLFDYNRNLSEVCPKCNYLNVVYINKGEFEHHDTDITRLYEAISKGYRYSSSGSASSGISVRAKSSRRRR